MLKKQDLKDAGLKVTLPRMKILEILESSDTRHMSAEEVYKQLIETGKDIGMATVYRVLTQFEAAGLVARHNFESGHSVYEINQGHHHDHILCIRCGKVDEFYDEIIEQRQREIAQQSGYDMTDHSLYIYGVCKTCQTSENK